MSLLVDREVIRSAADRRREEAERFKQDQAFLESTKTLPPGFRGQALRSDLAANRRHDRLQLLARLLALALAVAALYLSSIWHAHRRAAALRGLHEAEAAAAAQSPSPVPPAPVPESFPKEVP